MHITLVTPTGDRPEAFALCEGWVRRQTRKPDLWICTDDGRKPTKFTMGQQVIRYQPDISTYKDRKAQPRKNLIRLVEAAPYHTDVVVVMEDDDWYPPSYIEEMAIGAGLGVPFLSPRGMRAFHLGHGWYQTGTSDHMQAFQLAFGLDRNDERRLYVLEVLHCLEDIPLAQEWTSNGRPESWRNVKNLAVGIKGMPGRSHAGSKVNKRERYHGKTTLDQLIGDDAKFYEKWTKHAYAR